MNPHRSPNESRQAQRVGLWRVLATGLGLAVVLLILTFALV